MTKSFASRTAASALLVAGVSLSALFTAYPSWAQDVPANYPADYASIIEGSRAEGGVTIFSNVGEVNWRPVIEAFEAKYSWINVQTIDLGASEVFERFYADSAAGSNSADILLSSSTLNWLEMADQGHIEPYVSPETPNLPAWTMPLKGVYSISVDPMVIAYNKLILTEQQWPKSLSDVTALAKADPASFDHRMGTYGPNTSGFSQNMFYSYSQHVGDKAVENFTVIGPMTELYRSVGPVLEKITTGEYPVGYFISGISLFPLMQDPARSQVIGWTFDADGAVMVERNFAISKDSKNPNSARLFADFLLSQEGQQAVGVGGLVPYRSDVDPEAFVSKLSYDRVVEQVGADNIVLVAPDPKILPALTEFDAVTAKLFNESGQL